jgi:hypothetical protein
LEPLELKPAALKSSLPVNFFCSIHRSGLLQRQNRTFLAAGLVRTEVRDSSLNGICASGTLVFLNLTRLPQSELLSSSAVCNYTATLAPELCESADALSLALEEFQRFDNPSHWQCDGTSERFLLLCQAYNAAQEVCLQSAVDRFTAFSIIGVFGILCYPFFFWRMEWNWLSMCFPIVLGAFMQAYGISPLCSFYSKQRLAPYMLSIAAFLLIVQGMLCLINLRTFSTSQFERYLIFRRAGNSDLVSYRKATALP